MDIHEAKEIVELLANGFDPTTGEVFPSNSPYNKPEIISALFTVLNSVRPPTRARKKSIEEKQNDNIENGKPKNAGLPWKLEERKEVADLFNDGKTIEELSDYFERTSGAIKSELTHQGLIE
jgi:hypothetical protein